MLSLKHLAVAGSALTLLSACTVGPAYERPQVTATALPTSYKALDGWKVATPGDLLDRGDWWTLLGDPQLDALVARVNVSNQTIAAAEASYRQARALVREQRAGLFPTIDLLGFGDQGGRLGLGQLDRRVRQRQPLPGQHRRQLGARSLGASVRG